MSWITDWLMGSEDRFERLNNYTPEQMGVLNQTTGMAGKAGAGAEDVLAYLREFMNPESDVYKNFEAPYLREYEHGVGKLAERFAGAGGGVYGGGGALSSSGFGQALGQGQGDLQAKLAGMKAGLRREAGQDILGQYNTSTNAALGAKPYDYKQIAGQKGVIPGLIEQGVAGFAGGGGMGGMLMDMLKNKLFNSQQGRLGGNVQAGASARY